MHFYALGIDTSNYTTSIALVNQDKSLVLDNRKLLDVKEGQKGLRQSDALFQHVINLPELFAKITDLCPRDKIKVISVSSKPRPKEESYMPVFLAAKSYGQVLSQTLECSYIEFSHQENHIEGARWSVPNPVGNHFLGVHLSGGTTEILIIEKKNLGYEIDLMGGTYDISAGQLIDRIGVKLGYPFPAGKYMDEIALQDYPILPIPISLKDTYFNLSGLETKCYQLLEGNPSDIVVKSIFHGMTQTIGNSIINASKATGLREVLCFGGVASSLYLRNYLMEVANQNKMKIFFGEKQYCTDNAVGTALLGLEFFSQE